MGYRLEITKNKKGNDNSIERIDNLTVKELIAGVDVMSTQLELILEEVKKRDKLVSELEDEKNELNGIISKLTEEIQIFVNTIEGKNSEIERLNNVIQDQHNIIEERNNKIKRMESEAQERYEDNCKLKDKIIDIVNEKNDLERKLEVISNVLKNNGDDK